MAPVTNIEASLSPTDRSSVRRHRDRQRSDRGELHAVLDEAWVCHLGRVVDGEPVVLPTLHVRVGEVLYLHGSSGSLRGDEPVCVTVTLLDGLVLSRRWFTHSANYRSAVVQGRARRVDEPGERLEALRALVEHVTPGETARTEAPSGKELAATAVIALDLTEASVKTRSGPPGDGDVVEAGDLRWAGVIPVHTVLGAPITDPRLPPGVAVPPNVAGPVRSTTAEEPSGAA